jgi:hypothetical protein
MLLPWLRQLSRGGIDVRLATEANWVPAFQGLAPDVFFLAAPVADAIDLDQASMHAPPTMHRIEEVARLAGVSPSTSPCAFSAPDKWREPWSHLAGATVFAPEASHPARSAPVGLVNGLSTKLVGRPLVLLGIGSDLQLPADFDLRGRTSLQDALAIVSLARCVVTMDSAVLHMCTLLDIPCLALFGGVDPRFRSMTGHRLIAVTGRVDCWPCNKKEICDDRYDCIQTLDTEGVLAALDELPGITEREIRQL